MPATPSPDVRRGKLPQALFWAGMGLAPLAVLVLLFGQSAGSLRVAVVLAVLTIVLLAVSIAVRPSVDMLRVDIEHRVLDEMERIRLRAREETTAAARTTQRALAERIGALTESVAHLRAQVDEVQANAALMDPAALGPAALGYHAAPVIEPPGPPGSIRRTETVHVTRRTTYDDTGTVYGSRAALGAVDGEWREAPEVRDEREDRDGRWHHREDDHWAPRRDGHHERPWTAERSEPPALPAARGEPAHRYDDRGGDRFRDDDRHYDDRDHRRYDDRDRGGHERDRGYERDRGPWSEREPDRGWQRGRDEDRDRGYEREPVHRGPERERERGYERYDREPDRDRGHDRDRGSDRDRDRDRGHDRGYERYDREPDRGWDRERPPVPRPRSPQW